ncbi:MAG: HAMP domain-containing histidine kinase [Bacteroidales bacterium]|nr:HAMP domain-containing histidine kinase [Bacteroidales bacterium]
MVNIYSRRLRWKYFLFITAIIIGVASLLYTNKLVRKLASEERKKVELWAKATNLIVKTDISGEYLDFLLNVIQYNATVPVIVVDTNDNILFHKNLDTLKIQNEKYIKRKLEKMKQENEPIEIIISEEFREYLYYDRSTILTKLIIYPYVQLAIILLFILVSYFAFSSSRKAEQNQVWVGLSKETAHQLGTPISSLLAWLEMLKLKIENKEILEEFEKDIKRLEVITERFSKIGSKPKLKKQNIIYIINNVVNYLKTRSSNKIIFKLGFPEDEILVSLNSSLFEWVIENVCKNAIDAIEGSGTIEISIADHTQVVYIDITDSGKGIPKSKYKTIFKPGFTTKEHGWGLGLSLTNRIIEEYHGGKIFVHESELGKGTKIRIVLKK